jgi:site-specific DNA recombinase
MTRQALLYARVSTDDQAERGYSLTTQIDAMREYAISHGFSVVAEVADDCSGSIPVADRPGGGQVYTFLRDKRADVVILYTIDRTARDKRDYPIEFLIFLRDVQDAGAELHYVDSGKSEGSIVDLFKAWQAGEERKKIVERTTRGRLAKAKAGKWVGDSRPPYGYRQVGHGRDCRLEIDELEAMVVQRIFNLYTGIGEERLPLLGIAMRLTAEGVPPPRVGKRGEAWYAYTVKRLVRNPAYIGKFYYAQKTVNLDFPDLAIITPDIWLAAQEQTDKNRRLAGRNNKRYDYLLRGRMKCKCGLSLAGIPATTGGKTYLYYACGRYRGDRHLHTCTESYLPVEKTDGLVWDWIYGLISDEEKLNHGVELWQQQNIQQLEPKRSRLYALDELIGKSERAVDRLVVAFRRADSEVEARALERERKIAAKECEALTAEREKVKRDLSVVELTPERVGEIRHIARVIQNRLGNAGFEQKRETIDLLNFSAQLGYKDGQRGLWCTCSIIASPKFLGFDNHSSARPCG